MRLNEKTKADVTLGRYRALDLSDDKGHLCGKILADTGIEVIKIEPPGGDPARNIGPFYHGNVDSQKSLYWFAYNTGKKSITLNIETPDGRELFLRLLKSADFVIESFTPGYLKKLGLDYSRLNRVNPRLIQLSITGFGQTGPYSRFKAPDIVAMAMGGEMYLTGEPEHPPLRIGVPQSYLHAGAEAAVAAFIALWHRELTGEGQQADVSAQECITWGGFQNQSLWDLEKLNLTRQGVRRAFGRAVFRYLFPCKDGYITFLMLGGLLGADSGRKLVGWMNDEGMADEFLKGFDWDAFDPGTFTTEDARKLESHFYDFFLTKTKAELFQAALEKGIFLAPVNTPRDMVEDIHLNQRGFWVKLEQPELNGFLTYAGPAYRSDETPYRVKGRSPLIGENNPEIYQKEMGLTEKKLELLKGAGVI